MLPVQITTRDIPTSQPIEELIRKRANKLNQFHKGIVNCRVVIDMQQKGKHQGKMFNVRIDVNAPGKEFVVTKKLDADIYVAIAKAFEALERQLEEHSRKRLGNIKTHSDLLHGHIVRIISEEGYGFIKGMDDNEYYFSITNVSHPTFDQLVIGDAVKYISVPQDEGRQAHHVTRERHSHVNDYMGA